MKGGSVVMSFPVRSFLVTNHRTLYSTFRQYGKKGYRDRNKFSIKQFNSLGSMNVDITFSFNESFDLLPLLVLDQTSFLPFHVSGFDSTNGHTDQ